MYRGGCSVRKWFCACGRETRVLDTLPCCMDARSEKTDVRRSGRGAARGGRGCRRRGGKEWRFVNRHLKALTRVVGSSTSISPGDVRSPIPPPKLRLRRVVNFRCASRDNPPGSAPAGSPASGAALRFRLTGLLCPDGFFAHLRWLLAGALGFLFPST